MARPTWDELRPKVARLRATAAAEEAARQVRPRGWLYDPDGRRWTYRSAAGAATLCWLALDDDFGGGEWNYTYQRSDGKSGGGGLFRPLPRELAMTLVVRELEGAD